jgi:hypothetical protein
MNSAIFRNLKWIYFASFLFQVILLLVILLVTLKRGDTKIPGEWNYFLFPFGLILTLMVIVVGNIVYRNILKKSKQVDDIVAKLDKYKLAVLVRLGLLEGTNILMIIFYYLTSNYGYFAMIIALFFIFSISKPSKKTAKKDLGMFSRQR